MCRIEEMASVSRGIGVETAQGGRRLITISVRTSQQPGTDSRFVTSVIAGSTAVPACTRLS
jgi:hypothetical protein